MPIWERYEVETETRTVIIVNGRSVAQFTTYGSAEGGSNEGVDKVDLPGAVKRAAAIAGAEALEMGRAARANRRRKLGYSDGD